MRDWELATLNIRDDDRQRQPCNQALPPPLSIDISTQVPRAKLRARRPSCHQTLQKCRPFARTTAQHSHLSELPMHTLHPAVHRLTALNRHWARPSEAPRKAAYKLNARRRSRRPRLPTTALIRPLDLPTHPATARAPFGTHASLRLTAFRRRLSRLILQRFPHTHT